MIMHRYRSFALQSCLLVVALTVATIWGEDPGTSNGDGAPWQAFECPWCHRIAWAAHNTLGCQTGHKPIIMFMVDTDDPDDSPGIDVFIP